MGEGPGLKYLAKGTLLHYELQTCALQFIIGWHFHAGAVRALRRGSANMYVLVSLGTNAAYIYSVISAVRRRTLHEQGINIDNMGFFETSALLITFISLGKYLESHAKGRTSQVACWTFTLPEASHERVTASEIFYKHGTAQVSSRSNQKLVWS